MAARPPANSPAVRGDFDAERPSHEPELAVPAGKVPPDGDGDGDRTPRMPRGPAPDGERVPRDGDWDGDRETQGAPRAASRTATTM
ncbi:hypothetical protein J2W14_001606 [Pseudarthrobacter oxydans]|nr:hypothetical protein [Pseudarthrobacter oxydans]